MKRLLLLLVALIPTVLWAQPSFNTTANQSYKNALTNFNQFGIPRFTTAALPTCGTNVNVGAIAFDTTLVIPVVCNGTAWASTASGSITVSNVTLSNGGALRTTTTAGQTALLQAYDNDTGPGYVTFGTLTAGNSPSFLLASTVTYAGLTATRLAFAGTGGTLTSSADFTADATTNAAFVQLGSGTGPGALRLLEGSAGGVNYGVLTVPAALGGNRTYTFKDATGTVPLLEVANSWDLAQTYNAGIQLNGAFSVVMGGGGSALGYRSTLTPDGLLLGLESLNDALHVSQMADAAFDFNNGRAGTSAAAAPSIIIHSADQTTTEYFQQSVDTAGTVHLQGNFSEVALSGTKSAITEGSAQAIIRVGLPTSTNVYSMFVTYAIYDLNGSNYVVRGGGRVVVQGGNASGTATCTINTSFDAEGEDGSQIATSNAYTLTYTWTNVVSTTNCDLSLNASSSAGTNTYGITWTAVVNGNSSAITVAAQ